MTIKYVYAITCVVLAVAPALLAQSAATAPKAHISTRIFMSSGGSYLGIGVADIDAERAKALNMKEEHGVEVKSVEEDSPAAKAGLKTGDVVLEYNGQRIEGTQQFIRMVKETPAGRNARLVIQRGGATQTLTAAVDERKGKGFTMMSDDGQSHILNLPTPAMPHMPPMPPMPPMPRMPDLPNATMSWRSATLGVESESLSSQLAEFFGVKEGVLVRSVIKKSAAEKAGIKAGDVIVKVAEQKVASPREISSTLRGLKSKRTFPVVVIRNKQEVTLNVTLDENQGQLTMAGLFC